MVRDFVYDMAYTGRLDKQNSFAVVILRALNRRIEQGRHRVGHSSPQIRERGSHLSLKVPQLVFVL
jgi:hypothetical protein